MMPKPIKNMLEACMKFSGGEFLNDRCGKLPSGELLDTELPLNFVFSYV